MCGRAKLRDSDSYNRKVNTVSQVLCLFARLSLLQNEKKTNALKENSVAKDASQMEVETESQLLTDASERISTQDAEKAMMVELNASCWQNSNKNSASVEKRNQIDNAEQVVKEIIVDKLEKW